MTAAQGRNSAADIRRREIAWLNFKRKYTSMDTETFLREMDRLRARAEALSATGGATPEQ